MRKRGKHIMLLYILRHGDPIYNPDSLTERGHLQAAALAKRLARYGLDELYASPLIRAQQTAAPTAVLLNKPVEILDWTSENAAWADFSVIEGERRRWIFQSKRCIRLREPSVRNRGLRWYEDPIFSDTAAEAGYRRILAASDAFLAAHGYEHDHENCRYIAREPSERRVAVFCHQGFGLSWLGTLLDIPLPTVWSNMDFGHTGMTVIEFRTLDDGLCMPKMLTMANDSHLYGEGLPTMYQNRLFF